MADGLVPDVDAVAMGRLRHTELAAIEAQLNGPNPHVGDMDLPPALTEDGGRPS
jgi:hypothetical protein